MSNLLLRKLTIKSKIGFGIHKDLTVQELIQLNKHAVLIEIYFKLSKIKIDFDDHVKSELKLTGDRVIKKPGNNKELYAKHIRTIIDEIIENRNQEQINMFTNMNKKEKQSNIVRTSVTENKFNSKSLNQRRNQGKF